MISLMVKKMMLKLISLDQRRERRLGELFRSGSFAGSVVS
jgi:hypothetical protein